MKAQARNVDAQTLNTAADTRAKQANASILESEVPYSATNARLRSSQLSREYDRLGYEMEGIIRDNDLKDLNMDQLQKLHQLGLPLLLQHQLQRIF